MRQHSARSTQKVEIKQKDLTEIDKLVQPDEDDQEVFNFPEILELNVVKGMVKRNSELYEKIKESSTDVLTMWTNKVRHSLAFLKKPFLVWAKGELESPEAW